MYSLEYEHSFELITHQKFETGVVKRAASASNLFGNNVAEQFDQFCFSYYRAIRGRQQILGELPNLPPAFDGRVVVFQTVTLSLLMRNISKVL